MSLITRNIVINGRRTSIKLEAPLWEAFDMIVRLRRVTPSELCAQIAQGRDPNSSTFTSSVRVYIVGVLRDMVARSG